MFSIHGNSEYSVQDKHLANFCRSIGVKCFSTGKLFWNSMGLGVFSHWPSFKQFSLSPSELQYMWKQGAFFIHYFCSDHGPFYSGYDLIVEDKNYDINSIQSPKRRHNIRWALKHCNVERVTFELLEQKGPSLVEDTYKRLGLELNESVLDKWKNYIRAANSNPMFRAWGVFVSNQLAAFNFHIYCRDGIYIPMTFSCTNLLKWHPVDALVFVSTQKAIARDDISHVSYGRRPLTGADTESLLRFKESMGFKKIPLKERLEVHPILKPVLGRYTSLIARDIANRYSDRSHNARLLVGIIDTLRGYNRHPDNE